MRRKYVSLKTPRAVTPHIVKRTAEPKPKTVRLDDEERAKIIAVDFDGVLHLEDFPFIKTPNTALIEWIKKNQKKYTFILNTCRSGKQLQMAIDWLKEQGIIFDYVNKNCEWAIKAFGGDTRKIFADYYIDDKAYDWETFLRYEA